MRLIDVEIPVESRTDTFYLYAIGDAHVGALNCAETELRRHVRRIQDKPNAYWIAGGDLCDAVILKDSRRFDPHVLPDWMLEGGAEKVRKNLKDMLDAQEQRALQIFEPIKDKCIGAIEGNHEFAIMKHHNRDHMANMCKGLEVSDLTDCAFIRLVFRRGEATRTVRVFAHHGHGGGRTPGAEPNKLARMANDKDVDIVLTGHTHTFQIMPPIAMLTVPTHGKLPDDPIPYEKHAANWGCYVYSYKAGPSTYDSRAGYPVRPMYTVEIEITPHSSMGGGPHGRSIITMNEVRL
jgi:predicted phosphodiesterase